MDIGVVGLVSAGGEGPVKRWERADASAVSIVDIGFPSIPGPAPSRTKLTTHSSAPVEE